MPALPLDEAGKYVAGAYVVFVALLLVYVGIMAARLQRINRELGELAELAERGDRSDRPPDRPAADPDGEKVGAGRPDADPGTPGREAEDVPGSVSRRSSRQEVL